MVLTSSLVSLTPDHTVPAAEWTLTLAMQVKQIGSVQVSPDGKQAAFTVRSAVMEVDKSEYLIHIYLAMANGKSSWQLTQGDKSCDDPQWSPDGEWIGFLTARLGKKNLWLIRAAGGEALQLTDCKADVTSFRWSPNGRSIAFTAADAPTPDDERRIQGKDDAQVVDEIPKRQRLFAVSIPSPPTLQTEMRVLASGDFHISEGRPGRAAFDWSPDGKSIVFTHTKTPSQDDWSSADLSLVDVEAGTIRPLVHSAAAETTPLFSPDGQRIAFLESDTPATWAGSKSVRVIDANGGTSKPLAGTWDGFGRYSELVDWSADGQLLYFTEARGTNLKLLAMPMEGAPLEISQEAGMSLGGISLNASRTHFGFCWEQLDQPPEAFVSPVAPFEPHQISRVNGALPMLRSGQTEVIRWTSEDGLEIEGLLTYPAEFEKSKRYPFLLVIHGGPMGVFTQTFDGNAGTYPVAVFSSKGYAVLRANVRGSSGYGQIFRY
jgi:dipeptidyl aminopeptidase/acylaminoacyl peptidase